jgi:hypothetical protein
MMPFISYTEYREKAEELGAKYEAGLDTIRQTYMDCHNPAMDKLRAGEASNDPDVQFRARLTYELEEQECYDDMSKARQTPSSAFRAVKTSLGGGLAVASKNAAAHNLFCRSSRSRRQTTFYRMELTSGRSEQWLPGDPTRELTAIFTVNNMQELEQLLSADRFANPMLLMAPISASGSLVLGGEAKSFASMAADWPGKIRTHVDDVVYLEGGLEGGPPQDTGDFRKLLGPAGSSRTGLQKPLPGTQTDATPPTLSLAPCGRQVWAF